MSRFHHGSLDNQRLKVVLDLLRSRAASGATTMEINTITNSTRASSDVSEIRHNGLEVVCVYEGRTQNNRKINRYYLAEYAPKVEA